MDTLISFDSLRILFNRIIHTMNPSMKQKYFRNSMEIRFVCIWEKKYDRVFYKARIREKIYLFVISVVLRLCKIISRLDDEVLRRCQAHLLEWFFWHVWLIFCDELKIFISYHRWNSDEYFLNSIDFEKYVKKNIYIKTYRIEGKRIQFIFRHAFKSFFKDFQSKCIGRIVLCRNPTWT